MYFARFRAFTDTLRFRLAVWNASVVLLTAIATLFGLRAGVHFALVNEMDQILLEDLREVELSVTEQNYPASTALFEGLNRKAEAHRLHNWYVRLLDEQGEQLFASVLAPPKTPIMPSHKDFAPLNVGNFRVVQYRYQFPGKPPLTIRVGSSLEAIHTDMARIDRNVTIVSAVILVFAPLCGYWLAGRATAPLADIIRTTGRLRPHQLDERLVIRGTGDELDQLSRTFNRLLDRIGAYLDQKRDFLANAAHELRSPLAAIRSSVEVALAGDRSREEYVELLTSLIEECMALETLVNQLLLLAETEADSLKLHAEPVRLDELVERSAEMFDGVADFKGIELTVRVERPTSVDGHRQHLRQVLNNLIDNALKFTPRGGRVMVRLHVDADSRRAVLQVSDTGGGISAEDRPRVFERFFRSDRSRPRTGETHGTGLGLSICEAVVLAHGGQISVESEPGQGSLFTVTLPLSDDRGVLEEPSRRG